jgi:hypothetical protein
VARIALAVGLAVLLAACSLVGPLACPTALLEGTLVDDGGGRLAVETGVGVTAVQWPDGYRVDGDQELVLRDGWGRTIATEGDTIYVGGGMNESDDTFIACEYVSRDPP